MLPQPVTVCTRLRPVELSLKNLVVSILSVLMFPVLTIQLPYLDCPTKFYIASLPTSHFFDIGVVVFMKYS